MGLFNIAGKVIGTTLELGVAVVGAFVNEAGKMNDEANSIAASNRSTSELRKSTKPVDRMAYQKRMNK